jgi:membrane-associated protein
MLLSLLLGAEFHWTQLLQPQFYVEHGGLWLVILVVFAETGLFAGFFLPGDSLLFVAGIYSSDLARSLISTGNEIADLFLIGSLISAAGITGNFVGFWFGKKVGHAMYEWKDNLLFKKRYLTQAHDFYEKHGGGAIVIARFIPIVRTFAPIVAGIVGMDQKKFSFFNIVGCVAWVFSMLFAGHFLQKWILARFGFDLRLHLEVIVLGIVFVTTAPLIYKLIFHKSASDAGHSKPQ